MKKALVLGGGGSRGAAHVGVIRALHERGFVPDMIVGVSIGALVGAGYALLNDGEELWKGAVRIYSFGRKFFPFGINTVSKPMNPLIARMACSYMSKRESALSASTYFRIFKRTFGDRTFKDTRIEFHCISTSLQTGETIVHSSGKLIDALTPSISIPGIFPPVKAGNDLLIDGGTTCNLPCSLARQLGAEYIVAVDLGFSQAPQEPSTSNAILSIGNHVCDEILDSISIEAADFVIRPILDCVDSLDFRRCLELMRFAYADTLNLKLPEGLIQ